LSGLAISPDGRRVLITKKIDAGDDWYEEARVWDAATGHPLTGPLFPERWRVSGAEFSPDGRRILLVFGSLARVWDATPGHPLPPLLREDAPIHRAPFSPDGRRLLTLSGAVARVWNFADDRPADDWLLLARLLARRQVDATGALVPRESEHPAEDWERLR